MRFNVVVVCLTLLGSLGRLPAASQERGEQSRTEIEKIVRAYILQHPEVIAQAANLYQEQQKTAAKARAEEVVTAKLGDLQHDPGSPAIGSAKGVSVVEFFDYHCGYCKRAEPTIEQLVVDHPDINFVFKEFPILGPESTLAAKASLAANKQDGYLQFHQMLMKLPGSITMTAIEQLAVKQGLNVAKLKSDMESPEVKSILDRNSELASQVGVKATPTFVIGSELVQGAIDAATFERLIAQAKAAVAKPSGSGAEGSSSR